MLSSQGKLAPPHHASVVVDTRLVHSLTHSTAAAEDGESEDGVPESADIVCAAPPTSAPCVLHATGPEEKVFFEVNVRRVAAKNNSTDTALASSSAAPARTLRRCYTTYRRGSAQQQPGQRVGRSILLSPLISKPCVVCRARPARGLWRRVALRAF